MDNSLKIKVNYKQYGGTWSDGDYVQTSSGKGTIIGSTHVGPGVIMYNVRLSDGSTITVPWSDLKPVELTPRKTTSDVGTDTESDKSVGISTPLSPKSVTQKDILTLIALNTIAENIRDANRPIIKQYNPYLESPYLRQDIQDVGDNFELQEDLTDFFYEKTLKWLDKDLEFNKIKKTKKVLKSKKGRPYINKILKSFVKKNKVNWYELRDEKNYDDVKDYIRNKLNSL